MAETVHFFLKVNGKDIQGESTQKSLGRENSIECLRFQHSTLSARDMTTGLATGRRQYQPIKIVKRIDKSTPLLYKAMTENAVCEGEFKFYRPNPSGDGTTEQFYSIKIGGARVTEIHGESPHVEDLDTANQHPYEEIQLTFGTINWTYTNGGATHEDTWHGNR
jgi:type VI secretion system secreted protein Hcp